MNTSRLNELFDEIKSRYHNDYKFSHQELIQYMGMSFHVGFHDKNKRTEKPVIRGDGKIYSGVREAARRNKIRHGNIITAIKKGWKSAGYTWKYKNE